MAKISKEHPEQPSASAGDPPSLPKRAKAKYACIYPVKHNGKLYTDEIDLTPEDAEPLLASDAIRQV